MLLSYVELVELVEQGVITGVQPGAINAASIDVRLGDVFLLEAKQPWYKRWFRWFFKRPAVDLMARESVGFTKETGRIVVPPHDFLLAHTIELFHLPNHISVQFCLKSSLARNGLEQLEAGWADAGFNKSVLTLELKNMTRHHDLILTSGMFIGQLKFFRHTEVPEEASYSARGRYNGDASVSAIKL
jgi:deoxycytidine triphosphate deaminase